MTDTYEQQHQNHPHHHGHHLQQQPSTTTTPTNNTMMNMADQIHAEVRCMIGQSRLTRNSQGIALVHRQDLQIKELLGRGAFSEVHDVIIRPSRNTDPNQQQSSSTTSYAMKHIKARLLTQPENFRLAAAELAIEAHMLASFDHPNIMKIRGWAANGVASFADGRHDSFFLLLDKLDETLDNRITTWQRLVEHEQQQLQEIEQQIRVIQQKQQQQKNILASPPSSLNGGNIVSDLWRRFSLSQSPSSHQRSSSITHSNAILPNQQQENIDPDQIKQEQQQQQQQQYTEKLQQHHITLQQLRQQQQHRYESLLLEKFGICVEIASALAYLHENGVIFRDLKPNNIGFLSGRVQLFDFGLSRELPSLNLVEPFEMSGKVGTLRYMAVEVACHSEYNVSADVYSWSMVCYEIFTLQKPFAGWTRDMHSNLVCGRGIRPEFPPTSSSSSSNTNGQSQSHQHHHPVQPAVKQLLELCWHQQAYRRPTMHTAEQRMKQLEEQQLFTVCALDRTKLSASQSFNVKYHHPQRTNAMSALIPAFGATQHQQQHSHIQYQNQLQQQQGQQFHHPSHQPQHQPVHHQQQMQHQPQQMYQEQQQHSLQQQQQQQGPMIQVRHSFGLAPHTSPVVELPLDFTVEKKMPNRNHSETYCTTATTMSNISCDSVDVTMHLG